MITTNLHRLSVALATLAALPVHAADYTDTASVVSTTPIIERIREPRQECTSEMPPQRTQQAERSVMAPIIGGVAGALLGSTVGRGSGRDAAMAAGAIAGAIVGDRIDNQPVAEAPIQRCRTVETIRETTRGYTVVYRYNGRDVSTTLPYDPGPTVRVGVGVIGSDNVAVAPAYAVPAPRHQGPGRYAVPPGYDYRY